MEVFNSFDVLVGLLSPTCDLSTGTSGPMSPLHNVPLRWRVLIGEHTSLVLAFEAASLSVATTRYYLVGAQRCQLPGTSYQLLPGTWYEYQ